MGSIVKPGRKALAGQVIEYGQTLVGTVESVKDDGNRIIKFTYDGKNIYEILDEIGNMPIPPYIKERLTDKNRYQTVYAKHLGSAAAPTAGLHFTKELLEKLKKKGVIIKYVTLHVGLGTFRPVKTSDITKHIMHSEHYFVPQDTERKQSLQQKRRGGVSYAWAQHQYVPLKARSVRIFSLYRAVMIQTSLFIRAMNLR